MRNYKSLIFIFLIFIGLSNVSLAQDTDTSGAEVAQGTPGITATTAELQEILNQKVSRTYTIAGATVTGNKNFESSLILNMVGVNVGDKVKLPGSDYFSKIINRLWGYEYFSNIVIYLVKAEGQKIWVEINVVERPRLARLYFKGIPKSQGDELKGKIGIVTGRVLTESKKVEAERIIKTYYAGKGFQNIKMRMVEVADTANKSMEILNIYINRGNKVKIANIHFYGNQFVAASSLRKKMKGTREKMNLTLTPAIDPYYWGDSSKLTLKDYFHNLGPLRPALTSKILDPYFRFKPLTSSRFEEKKYIDDKEKIIDYYNSIGYRDAAIIKDTNYYNSKGNLVVNIKLDEGHKYYFGKITWKGNTLYSDSILSEILGVHEGDIFDQTILNNKLGITMDPNIADISGLYMDQGYLFFHATPVEAGIRGGDTIDYEIHLAEGDQATLKYVRIGGNEKTNEHVARRILRTYPGDLFNRDLLIRSQRQLSSLPYFDPEHVTPTPVPNEQDGTVDINWEVAEKSSDQLELSAGFGGGIGLTGTLGLTFGNFSTNQLLHKGAWDPLPTGDGQTLALKFQSNGRAYRSYSVSFTEPWLGGKKQNGLTVSVMDTKYSNGYNYYTQRWDKSADTSWFRTTSLSVGYTKQLRWPDDYFSFGISANYTRYQLKNYYIDYYSLPSFRNGVANNFNIKLSLNRYSLDNPIFPRSGSNFLLSAQLTPPYSLWDKGIATSSNPYKWVEYHKWRFTGEWYVPLTKPIGTDKKQLVLKMSAKYGYIGKYNSNPNIMVSPFERFQVGNSGLSNTYSFLGYDIISQRGYPVYDNSDPSVNPDKQSANQYFTIFNKYTTELRFPISLSPQSTIFALGFFEAANGWYSFKDYQPFRLRRSVGLGMRFNLPMFGLLGFDYGLGLDNHQPGQGLKGMGRFTFMLGYEPD